MGRPGGLPTNRPATPDPPEGGSTMKSTFVSIVALLTLGIAAAAAAAAAEDSRPGPVTYRLSDDAAFLEGCYQPCLCPIRLADLAGTYRLVPLDISGTWDTYEILDVQWTIGLGDQVMLVTGSGTYVRFSEFVVQERLELDLIIDGQPAEHFDSGWVIATVPFPDMQVTASMNDMYCYDRVFVVDASPISEDTNGDGVIDIDDLTNVVLDWGGDGSAYGGDVDGSGAVDVDDITAIIVAWGPCG
jgi:hypothetical protein